MGMEEPAIVQSMYIYKNPGVGSEGRIIEFRLPPVEKCLIGIIVYSVRAPGRNIPLHGPHEIGWLLVCTWRRHPSEWLFKIRSWIPPQWRAP